MTNQGWLITWLIIVTCYSLINLNLVIHSNHSDCYSPIRWPWSPIGRTMTVTNHHRNHQSPEPSSSIIKHCCINQTINGWWFTNGWWLYNINGYVWFMFGYHQPFPSTKHWTAETTIDHYFLNRHLSVGINHHVTKKNVAPKSPSFWVELLTSNINHQLCQVMYRYEWKQLSSIDSQPGMTHESNECQFIVFLSAFLCESEKIQRMTWLDFWKFPQVHQVATEPWRGQGTKSEERSGAGFDTISLVPADAGWDSDVNLRCCPDSQLIFAVNLPSTPMHWCNQPMMRWIWHGQWWCHSYLSSRTGDSHSDM